MSSTSSKFLVGIIDCNNFYVSCEIAFQPKLLNKPVIVLSNNDGCVISRSNEAKALGIKMGQPYFKIQDLIKKYNINVRSSNYALYGDMSLRVMTALRNFVPRLEVYSIDEAFIDLSGISRQELIKLSTSIVHSIYKWTGIPITMGIGPSKTLAKLANFIAKQQNLRLFNFTSQPNPDVWLSNILISDIWGIGRGWHQKLQALNIYNALDLKQQDASHIRQLFNIKLAQTVLELQGQACFLLETDSSPKKQIIASRSFGAPLTTKEEVFQALSFHIARAAQRLRQQATTVKELIIFIETSRFAVKQGKYRFTHFINLPQNTSDTRKLLQAARVGLDTIFIKGNAYKRAGVKLLNVSTSSNMQLDLFTQDSTSGDNKVMQLLDSINNRYGRNTLSLGSQGHAPPFIQAQYLSPAYTTCWNSLLKARAY